MAGRYHTPNITEVYIVNDTNAFHRLKQTPLTLNHQFLRVPPLVKALSQQ